MAAFSAAAQHSSGQEPFQHGAGAQLQLPHQLPPEGMTPGDLGCMWYRIVMRAGTHC
jgi:hypothetical protein